MQNQIEPKVSKSYSLDPVVVAWLTQQAALKTIEGKGQPVSASEIANSILREAMEREGGQHDTTHLKNFIEKKVLKQK